MVRFAFTVVHQPRRSERPHYLSLRHALGLMHSRVVQKLAAMTALELLINPLLSSICGTRTHADTDLYHCIYPFYKPIFRNAFLRQG